MSGMVSAHLLNQDAGLDRKSTVQTDQRPSDQGPSRYDQVVQQQEKRLEQQRQQDKLEQRRQQERAEQSRQQEQADRARKQQAEPAEERPTRETSETAERAESGDRREAHSEAANNDRHDSGSQPSEPRSSDGAGQDNTVAETPDQVAANKVSPTDTVIDLDVGQSLDPSTEVLPDDAEALPDPLESGQPLALFVASGPQAVGNGPGSAPTMSALNAGATMPGQTRGNVLFSAMMEAGQDAGSPTQERDGLIGGRLGSLQGMDQGGKTGDLFASQLAARMTANDQPQPLTQGGLPRGQDTQSLIRSYSTTVDVPVEHDEWGEKVMGKLTWLTASQMSVAEIHVTPADLGPLDVRVQVQNDQATVTVHATTPAVREQLELHGHRLRDMLNEQGIQLEGFDVSDSGERDGSGPGTDGDADSHDGTAAGQSQEHLAADSGDVVKAGELDLSWNGEVDLYA